MSNARGPVPWNRFGETWDRSSPSAGSDNRGQGRQRHVLPPVTLYQFSGSSEGNKGNVSFRVDVPDSRLRVNIALIGKPTGANTDPLFIGPKAMTMWLRAVEDAQQGGNAIPITNLWGTSAVPDPMPGYVDPTTGLVVADANLGGWGKEFVTAGNAIEGTIFYTTGAATGAGLLLLQVRYVPEAIRFPDAEWQEIAAQCNANVLGFPLLLAE